MEILVLTFIVLNGGGKRLDYCFEEIVWFPPTYEAVSDTIILILSPAR